MPLCLSLLDADRPEVTRNHARYCQIHGYPHRILIAHDIEHPTLVLAFHFSQMLMHLRELAENDWLLCLDADVAIYRPVPLDSLILGRQALLVDGPPDVSAPSIVMRGMMALRNTPQHRRLLHALLEDIGRTVGQGEPIDISRRLRETEVLPCNATIAGPQAPIYVHVSWRIVDWHRVDALFVNLGRHTLPTLDVEFQHDRGLQRLLANQLSEAMAQGTPVLAPPAYPALSSDDYTCVNPQASIGFAMLYTANISAYARVAEHNIRRYCERHGYAFHVYRAIPPDIGVACTGNWVKPWVLLRHLAQHDWLIWIDADMLFVDQRRRIDPMLQGRETLLVRDVGDWPLNSGLMGFRRTSANQAFIEELWRRITVVNDKTDVYSSMGDQFYASQMLREAGRTGEADVIEYIAINTPYFLRSANSFLLHFLGLGEPYRSVYMAETDRLSLLAG